MILLTALPRTGKSTAIKKIVSMLGVHNCGGFYTEEIRENDNRVGFEINTITGETATLAHVNIESIYKISRYGVDLDTFEDVCLNKLEEAMVDDNIKYIIIDEIGPMQLFSDKYKKILLELLQCSKPVIGTIFMNSYEWLDEFKKNDNINFIEITFENRNNLPLEIVKMVTKDNTDLQRKVEKAIKYSMEDYRFNIIDNKVIINSEHGIRIVEKEKNKIVCNCDFYKRNGTCSHVLAVINKNLLK